MKGQEVRRHKTKKWMLAALSAVCLMFTACGAPAAESGSGAGNPADTSAAADHVQTEGDENTQTEIQVFVAASLRAVTEELAAVYNETQPNVKILINADSSGALLAQIQEGFACDIFFSADQKQMNALEADGMLVEGTRTNVVNNQVVVVTRKDSGTKVSGLADIGSAQSIALAAGSVPVGKYTRTALMNMGVLEQCENPDDYTSAQVAEALGGVTVSEQSNVSSVRIAVAEGSCEVGTIYYSDLCGYEEELEMLEKVDYELTGNVIYPLARVVNSEADALEQQAADDFFAFLLSDTAKAMYEAYYFDTNVN